MLWWLRPRDGRVQCCPKHPELVTQRICLPLEYRLWMRQSFAWWFHAKRRHVLSEKTRWDLAQLRHQQWWTSRQEGSICIFEVLPVRDDRVRADWRGPGKEFRYDEHAAWRLCDQGGVFQVFEGLQCWKLVAKHAARVVRYMSIYKSKSKRTWKVIKLWKSLLLNI